MNSFSALAQPIRLEVFRLLLKQKPESLAAGEIARRLDVPRNTMSNHLTILPRSGLVSVRRRSRNMIYRAELETVRELVTFMFKDCCNGQPELRAPLVEDLTNSSFNLWFLLWLKRIPGYRAQGANP